MTSSSWSTSRPSRGTHLAVVPEPLEGIVAGTCDEEHDSDQAHGNEGLECCSAVISLAACVSSLSIERQGDLAREATHELAYWRLSDNCGKAVGSRSKSRLQTLNSEASERTCGGLMRSVL